VIPGSPASRERVRREGDIDDNEFAPLGASILDLASRASRNSICGVSPKQSASSKKFDLIHRDTFNLLSPESFWQTSPPSSADPSNETARGARPSSRGAVHALQAARQYMLTRPLSFEDFAVEIVPVVRMELTEVRQDVHFSEFMHVLEDNGSSNCVALTMPKFERLATRLGIKKEIFDCCVASLPEPAPAGIKSAEDSHEAAKSGFVELFGPAKSANVKRIAQEDSRLTFEAVHEMLISMEEEGECIERAREREIMKRTGLNKDKFCEHRFELNRLYEFFQLYDGDQSDALNYEEVRPLLKHVGLDPYRKEHEHLVSTLLHDADTNGNESLTFNEFLLLMKKVRSHQKTQREYLLRLSFRKFAAEGGRLELDKVDEVMVAVGIGGTTKAEMDLQRNLVYDWDVDNSGDISFEEFADICQRVQERVWAHRLEETTKFASSIGIGKSRLCEYLWAFDEHDRNRSGALSKDEIAEVIHTLSRQPITQKQLQDLLGLCDIKDMTVDVPLDKYLQLMHTASVHLGVAVLLPITLRDISAPKLHEILCLFPLAESYVKTLDVEESRDLVASYLGVTTGANLNEDLDFTCGGYPVENVRQLISYARRVALAGSNPGMISRKASPKLQTPVDTMEKEKEEPDETSLNNEGVQGVMSRMRNRIESM